MKHLVFRLTLVAAVLLVAVPVAGAAGNPNPGVLPPNARVQGLTLGEWGAKWWQTMFAIPVPENPMIYPPTECFVKRVGNVGLGTFFFQSTGTFDCTMPPGMVLYQPIAAGECSNLEAPPCYGTNEEELRAADLATFTNVNLQMSIDGVAVRNPNDYLVLSPMYQFTVPENNILGAPAGSGLSVADNGAVLLSPLSPGQHTLHLHAEADVMGTPIVYDWTYNITVTK